MTKYSFRIRTRTGMIVENLNVQGRDRAEAERKLNQVYRHCKILECLEVDPSLKGNGLDLEDMISLINKQEEKKS
ncbi:MAG TPA: hypothetical protein VD839_05635 [Burkholderiales bacterium]|jgi:hypothetical protein|nr:hypothetical protein [Burkholderiales bacterium]